MPNLNKRTVLARIAICIVFAFMVTLQFRFAELIVNVLSNPEALIGVPKLDLLTLAYENPGKATTDAGIKKGDTLLAINSSPVHSRADEARLFYSHKPGDVLELTVQRGQDTPFRVRYIIPGGNQAPPLWAQFTIIILNFVIPWSCLLLAFLVAFRRPLEPVVWPLVLLLVCLSQDLRSYNDLTYAWEPAFSWVARFFDACGDAGVAAAWLWASIQFPDPRSPNRFWPWSRFVLGLPLFLLYAVVGIWFATAVQNPKALAALAPLKHLPGKVLAVWGSALIILGCVNLALKLKRETNLSMRRRLRWAVPGLVGGILPVTAAVAFTGGNVDSLPHLVELICLVSPLLIPLTLAYALLVDRLFDLGVVVRQGLLASKTVAAVRTVLIAFLIYLIVFFVSQKHVSGAVRFTEVAACALAIALTRRAAEWLRGAVDRRFFQQEVNSEQLLINLSSEVRGIRDADTLLRTVTDRVGSAMYLSRVAALLPDTTTFVPAYAYAGGDSTPLPFDDPAVADMKTSLRPTPRLDDLLVPISTGPSGVLQGLLWLGPKRSEEPYSSRDLSLLESVAGQTALALENTKLTATVVEEAANRERINSELELARTVQERLFPKAAPQVPGLDLAGLCRPAQTVGGDYFDFFTMSSGLTGFAIGDVAGKGISAALLVASLQASLRAIALSGFLNLSDLMAKLNVLMYDVSPANRFATFFCCLYDATTGRLLYSSAGHNPALLIPANPKQQPMWLHTRGNALGLTRKSTYEQAELVLQPGDRLVLYTDGVTEARNPAGDEFGEARLLETICGTANCSASTLADSLLKATVGFAGSATQHDDITLITVISR